MIDTLNYLLALSALFSDTGSMYHAEKENLQGNPSVDLILRYYPVSVVGYHHIHCFFQ